MNLRANWNYPTSVRFGAGRVKELGAAVKAAGITRPLLVTDPVLARLPMTQAALDILAAYGVAATVFADVKPNPVAANVEAGIKALHAGQHDGVVAFGGGSALDAGKVVAFMAGQTRPMWDFEDVGGRAPIRAVSRRSLRCRRRPGLDRRSAAPVWSRTRPRTRRR